MKYLVTGSSGHLGEALVRKLRMQGNDVVSIDINASPYTTHQGSITNRKLVTECMHGVDVVFHPATLHKPHVATHSKQDFIDTNVSGTLCLLEAAVEAGVSAFIFTSTTSTFGHVLRPPPGEPSAWITEDVIPKPKNIYGITKLAAENLCRLIHDQTKLPCIILRTSRFFPEDDDSAATRARFSGDNAKTNEFLYRRVDISDVVSAHLLAAEHSSNLGFGCYIISATTPFQRADAPILHQNAPDIVSRYARFETEYARRNWAMFQTIDRVYDNTAARRDLNWSPRFDFAHVLARLKAGERPLSELADQIGKKGYHDQHFEDGPYPVD